MKHLWKRIAIACMAMALTLSLTACGGGVTTATATLYIQGLMDMTYLGNFNPDYLDLIESSESAAEESYLRGLEVEAETFADFQNISNLTDELKDEIMALYKEIYAKSSYTVNTATKIDDKTFAVKVQVKPLDIMHLMEEAMPAYMDSFYNAYTEEQVQSMTDAEYEAYDAEWAALLIALCREKLPEMGYMEEQSLVVQMVLDDDGVWSIPQEDLNNLDYLIIDYEV